VTANTREDGRLLLSTAAHLRVRVRATPYRFDQANDALRDLAYDRVTGAAVLVVATP
jgi:propanol-preferring alcohol dehydrogenase